MSMAWLPPDNHHAPPRASLESDAGTFGLHRDLANLSLYELDDQRDELLRYRPLLELFGTARLDLLEHLIVHQHGAPLLTPTGGQR